MLLSGYCGSCWAFSATQQIESDAIRAGYITPSDQLSVQQVVSCDSTSSNVAEYMVNYGCEGGNTETAYAYINSVGGLTRETSYPYSSFWGVQTSCDMAKKEMVVTVDDYYTIMGEENMESYVLSTGPLSVCVDASDWSSYQSGIVSSCSEDVNHCVQVVGVDTDEGYWIVRNSWGTSWGVEGMIYLKTGQNTCGITNDPTYTTVAKVDA